MSEELRTKIDVHNVSEFEQRLIRDWVGGVAQSQYFGVRDAVAHCVLPVVCLFFADVGLTVHGQIGEEQKPPRYKTVQTGGITTEIPAEVQFFLELAETGERLVLQVEDFHDGDYRVTVHSTTPGEWIGQLKSFAARHNPLRGKAFDLDGNALDLEGIRPDKLVLTPQQQMAVERHILGFAQKFDELKERRGRLSRGVLLEGIPGCGKSLFLKTLPQRLLGFSACLATPDQLTHPSSMSDLKKLIELTAPCAVFLEEIDLFGTDRRLGGGSDMAELMQMMDGLRHVPGVLWIATTNRPEVVEKALSDRPGRFDRRIEFGPLASEIRGRVIDQLVKPQTISGAARDLVIHASDGWTGAQIGELCETMRLLSNRSEFHVADVELALEDCNFHGQGGFGFRRT